MFPNYTLYYDNPSQLMNELHIVYESEGWYKKGQDFVLVTKDGSPNLPDRLCAAIWDNHDPRQKWVKVLKLPLHVLKGGDVLNT